LAAWLGIGLLWLVVQLPYPLIYRLGNAIGRLAMRFMKRRAKIAYRNLELCFPTKASKSVTNGGAKLRIGGDGVDGDRDGLVLADPAYARWTDSIGVEHIRSAGATARHSADRHSLPDAGNGARMFGINEPGIGVYRPNDNPVIDWLQTWGRLRSTKT
jgi:KDO2-lipid IV(A) lauroyltransferase